MPGKTVVRARGLEPPILSEPDPKSGASAIPPRARPGGNMPVAASKLKDEPAGTGNRSEGVKKVNEGWRNPWRGGRFGSCCGLKSALLDHFLDFGIWFLELPQAGTPAQN